MFYDVQENYGLTKNTYPIEHTNKTEINRCCSRSCKKNGITSYHRITALN